MMLIKEDTERGGRVMTMNKIYYSAKDILEMLDISLSSAYRIIRGLNGELEKAGYIVLQGKVPRIYFHEKWYGLK